MECKVICLNEWAEDMGASCGVMNIVYAPGS